ncbi:hypothetical protein AMATHDRAFT_139710 [Amanita thiersii Skay4041]|uniref:Isochorismatase-like domain-containing protein n=1 Tax=Amanita thiersii Skay4041 TaxID=703135 RepID=A0A2A9NW74_9AGAR|nr:hypothetical protein AMATHDRAFT_139710 [Amanita thiersii Skay4041]
MSPLTPDSTLFFLCDIQPKFRPVIYGYEYVIATANKMIKLAKILSCEVVCTTQVSRVFGPIDPAIDLPSLGSLLIGTWDKTLFSMLIPQVHDLIRARPNVKSIVIFGIESHICVLQTVLSLVSLPEKYTVYVIADGVSSCNKFEVPIAISRMRTEGAVITTSESFAFQLIRDAAIPEFKAFSTIIKEEKESTKSAGDVLLLGTSDEPKNQNIKSSM